MKYFILTVALRTTTNALSRLFVPNGREYLSNAFRRAFGFNANSNINITCAHFFIKKMKVKKFSQNIGILVLLTTSVIILSFFFFKM